MSILLFVAGQVASMRPDKMQQTIRSVRCAYTRIELQPHEKPKVSYDKAWKARWDKEDEKHREKRQQ